jgi:hypothetical protein
MSPDRKRPLTELEEKFVAEATRHHFVVGFEDDGSPFAMGCDNVANLFSMDVEETPDAFDGGSVYHLSDD